MQTTAFWLALPESRITGLPREEVEGGLVGLASLLRAIAPIYLMCDPRDVGVVPQVKSPFTGRPDHLPLREASGRAGFAERLYAMRHDLLRAAAELALRCPCEERLSSCVGPAGIVGEHSNWGQCASRWASRPPERLVRPGVSP